MKLKPYKSLQESSLSRIWQHIHDEDSSFAVISAYRGIYSEAENLKRHNELKQKIRAMGFGYIEQKSGYSYSNPEAGEDVTVEEKSFFIPNIDFDSAIKLGRLFKQESILYKDSVKGFGLFMCDNGKLAMLFKNKDHLMSFNANDIKMAYSQLVKANSGQKGMKFAYVSEYYIPSRADAFKAMKEGKLAESRWIDVVNLEGLSKLSIPEIRSVLYYERKKDIKPL